MVTFFFWYGTWHRPFVRGKVFSSSILLVPFSQTPPEVDGDEGYICFYVFKYFVNVSFHNALPTYEVFGPFVSIVTIPAASVSS